MGHRHAGGGHVRAGQAAANDDQGDAKSDCGTGDRTEQGQFGHGQPAQEAIEGRAAQVIGLLGRESEVARPLGRGQCCHRRPQRGHVGRKSGAVCALLDQRASLFAVGAVGFICSKAHDQESVVARVARGVADRAFVHVAVDALTHATVPFLEPSSSRRASRPRWMRDLTVPSDTPVMSAISW